MPELPEVETIARTLAPQIVGRTIKKIDLLLPKSFVAGEHLLPKVINAPIHAVFRRAKVLLLGLYTPSLTPHTPLWEQYPLYLAYHLKMTGRFFVHPLGTGPLRHTRIVFTLDDGLLFFDDMRTFGYCRALEQKDFATWDFWQKLGPEPLTIPAKELALRLQKKNTSIKAALLNQTVVAGIGNIYADESLFRAGIVPQAKASSLSEKKLTILAEAVQNILTIAIQECGSSIRDYRDALGNAGAFQNNFFVYGRKNELCKKCNNPLLLATVAGRTTSYCGTCQK